MQKQKKPFSEKFDLIIDLYIDTSNMFIPANYQVIQTLSRGLYGPILLLQDKHSQRQVVLKSYVSNGDLKGLTYQCLREINAMRRMNGHPHFIELLDVCSQEDGSLQLIMNNGGDTLKSFLKMHSDDALKDRIMHVKNIGRQLLIALSALHKEGYLHRDLKPANLLINNNNLRICDFGLATKTDPLYPEQHSYQIGTLLYRAPELFAANTHNYSQAVDMWSVGCILYEMISGLPPFKGTTDYRVLSNIIKLVPTTEQDLQLLHLDNIRLDKCNTQSYHKIQSLYDPLVIRDPKLKDDIKALEYILHHLLILNPAKRLTVDATLQSEFFSTLDVCAFVVQPAKWFVRPALATDIINKRNLVIKEFIKTRWHARTLLAAIDIYDMALVAGKHLAISTCFILASKYYDLNPLTSVKKTYCAEERELLITINFCLDRPTILDCWSRIRAKDTIKLSATALQYVSSYARLINKSEEDIEKVCLRYR
jgi:serine/threonine protein kinase